MQGLKGKALRGSTNRHIDHNFWAVLGTKYNVCGDKYELTPLLPETGTLFELKPKNFLAKFCLLHITSIAIIVIYMDYGWSDDAPRKGFGPQKGGSPKKFYFTYADLAEVTGLTAATIKLYVHQKKFDPTNLLSVVRFVAQYLGYELKTPEKL